MLSCDHRQFHLADISLHSLVVILKDRALEVAGSKLGQVLLFCWRILFREGGVFVRFSDSAITTYSSFQQLLIVIAEQQLILMPFCPSIYALFCGRVLFQEGGVFVRISDSAIIIYTLLPSNSC